MNVKIEKVVVIDKLATFLLWFSYVDDDNRSNLNGNNRNLHYDNQVRGMALVKAFIMKSHKNLYNRIISLGNLTLAWRRARKGKTKRDYVIHFEEISTMNSLEQDEQPNQI